MKNIFILFCTIGALTLYGSGSSPHTGAGGGGGETNTSSNQGAGVGTFDNKNGVDFEHRSVVAASTKMSVALDAGNKEIDLDVNEANIDHDALTNFVAGEHFLQSAISITESQISDLSHTTNTDESVKVTANDTTPGNLFAKLIAGNEANSTSALEMKEVGDGGDEDLKVSLDESKISITESQISDLTHTDTVAIHDNVSAEISAITEKVTPIGADHLLIEDSADSNSKKRILISNLPMPALHAASAYSTGTFNAETGWSDPIPLDTTDFETTSTVHDPTINATGTATGTQTTTTLQDTSQSWSVNEFADYVVKTTGGTGPGQWRKIISNTSDTLTVGTWDTTPDGTTTYDVSLSSRLTVPDAGTYRVGFHLSFQNGSAGNAFGIAILINGSFRTVMFVGDNSPTELTFSDTKLFSLSADDYVEMVGYNGDGAVLGMNSGSLRMYVDINRVN